MVHGTSSPASFPAQILQQRTRSRPKLLPSKFRPAIFLATFTLTSFPPFISHPKFPPHMSRPNFPPHISRQFYSRHSSGPLKMTICIGDCSKPSLTLSLLSGTMSLPCSDQAIRPKKMNDASLPLGVEVMRCWCDSQCNVKEVTDFFDMFAMKFFMCPNHGT